MALLTQARETDILWDALLGTSAVAPPPPQGEEWSLELDDEGKAYLEAESASSWCTDILGHAVCKAGSGNLWLYMGSDGQIELDAFRCGYKDASWKVSVPPYGTVVKLQCALFNHGPGRCTAWLSVHDMYTCTNLKLYPGTAGKWTSKRLASWKSLIESLGLPPTSIRQSAPIGVKEADVAERCLTFTSLSCQAMVAVLGNMAAHSSRNMGGVEPGDDKDKIVGFLKGFLQPACVGRWELLLRLDKEVVLVPGYGPAGLAAFSLQIDQGVVDLNAWHTAFAAHSAQLTKEEIKCMVAFLPRGVKTIHIFDLLVGLMAVRSQVVWLSKQLVWQVGVRLDDLSGLLGGLPPPGSSMPAGVAVDLDPKGVLDGDWRHRNRHLTRYQLASIKHFQDKAHISFAGDASRVGGQPVMLFASMEPGGISAWAPPQALRATRHNMMTTIRLF